MKFLLAGLLLLVGATANVKVNDEAEFRKVIAADANLEKLATNLKFVEGPVWIKKDKCLLFSDIPANQIRKWTAKGELAVWRDPSEKSNGNTTDLDGNLVTAEHWARRVTRTTADGKVTVLADQYEGKKLNSPNDVIVKSDGSVWFTDPTYGLEGRPAEQAKTRVYRIDGKTGKVTAVAEGFDQPNGLCFSPDEKCLYVADSGRPRHIRAFQVKEDGTLDEGKVFCKIDNGGPDGIRCDAAGRVWSSAGDGVHIFSPEGKLIGKILVPETPANLCFGGEDGQTLFITARTSLYRIRTQTTAPRASARASADPLTVVLKDPGERKIQVITIVRAATGLGLKEAKDLVDGAPKAVKENLPREAAEKLKQELEAAGAQVELK